MSSHHTLKSIVQRGSMFGAAVAIVAATFIPSLAFADALNPLTERSLLLTSSAPGYQDTDGSGSNVAIPNANGDNFSPAGSGPNGRKSGETFKFKVSTDSSSDVSKTIKAFSLQYCTSAAGFCQAPGNNTGDNRDPDGAGPGVPNRGSDSKADKTSDLNVNLSSPVAGTDYKIFMGASDVSSGWVIAATNEEDTAHSGALTGANNFVTLTSTTGITPASGTQIRIVFVASEANYITNPGDDEFFVKINSYNTDDTSEMLPNDTTHIIDGGVTVANVMTDSIHITTKVLETMSFSVGTRNRDTVTLACAGYPSPSTIAAGCEEDDISPTAVHGTCDNIQQVDNNQLKLGNPDAEYSLETDTAWDVYSYWRLSSNSSGGATVYYSGNTLTNTAGDQIAPIGPNATASTTGTEQFGLGFVEAGSTGTDVFATAFTALVSGQPARYKTPNLYYLAEEADYAGGTGTINGGSPTASFAFEQESNTDPRVIATNNNHVISCDTAKMRYIANIGADTPAGVYTTKINYLAAPQY